MNILILGGTNFLGRHLINTALERGHEVTIFTRGRAKVEIPKEVEQLTGDRNGDLEALKGRYWDRVIDTSGYTPWELKASCELLKDKVKHYTFISSESVYEELDKPLVNEENRVEHIGEEDLKAVKEKGTKEAVMEHYGALKYLSEEEADRIMERRVLKVRPGLIVGEYDPTDRYTYWVHRIAQGGEILCPGDSKASVQFIDVKDLAL